MGFDGVFDDSDGLERLVSEITFAVPVSGEGWSQTRYSRDVVGTAVRTYMAPEEAASENRPEAGTSCVLSLPERTPPGDMMRVSGWL